MNIEEQLQTQSQDQSASLETPDYETFLRASMEELMAKTKSLQEAWGFGEEQDWYLDQESGQLTFQFEGSQVTARAQVIGVYDTQTGLWGWAWADAAMPEHLKTDALQVQAQCREFGWERFLSPQWHAEASDCWYMVAAACKLCNAEGAYRGVTGTDWVFMSFLLEPAAEAAPEAPAETVEQFTERTVAELSRCVENPDEQRRACCRYFKSGARLGFLQAELVDQLGLASPSLLDRAGYSPDACQAIMDMIGRIQDDEIELAEV